MGDIELPHRIDSSGGRAPRIPVVNAGDVPIVRPTSDPGLAVPKGAFADGEGLVAASKGIAAVGEDVYRAGLRQQKLQDANATTEASLAYDKTSMTEWNRRQVEDDPSRPGFMKDYGDWLGKQAEQHLSSLPDGVSDEARQKLKFTLATKQQGLEDAAGRLSLIAGQKKALDLIDQQTSQFAAQAVRDPDHADTILEVGDEDLKTYDGALTPDQERDKKQGRRQAVVQAKITGLVQQGRFKEALDLLGASPAAPPSQDAGTVTISPDARLATVNNNPGNLKFVGQTGATSGEGGFAKFETPEAGYRALQAQIGLDAGRGLTLAAYVAKAAPQTENDTPGYTQAAVKALGVSADTPLKDIPPDKVAAFVAKQESGTTVSSLGAPVSLEAPPSRSTGSKYDGDIDIGKAINYVQTQQRQAENQARADVSRSQQATEADAAVKVSRGELDHTGLDDLRASKKIDDGTWARLTIQRDNVEAAQAEQDRLTQRGMLFGRGLVADPKSKEDKKSIDLAFDATMQEYKDLTPAQQLDRGIEFATQKGMVPEPLKATIRGGLHSGNAEQAVLAADTVKRLRNANPALIADIGDENDLRLANTIGAYTDAGMSPAVAVQRATEAMKVGKTERDAREADYDLQRGKTPADRLASDKSWISGKLDGWFQADPNVDPVMAGEFNEIAKMEFGRTGNLDASRQTALDSINRVWGRTRIGAGGLQYMKFAPEKFYGLPSLSDKENGRWMSDQLLENVGHLVHADPDNPITSDRLVIAPDSTRVAPDGRPVYTVSIVNPRGTLDAVVDAKGKYLAWAPEWSSSPAGKRLEDDRAAALTAAREARSLGQGAPLFDPGAYAAGQRRQLPAAGRPFGGID